MLTRGAAAAGLFILALLAPSSAAIAGPNSDRGDVDFSNNGSLQEGTVSAGAQNPGSPAGGARHANHGIARPGRREPHVRAVPAGPAQRAAIVLP